MNSTSLKTEITKIKKSFTLSREQIIQIIDAFMKEMDQGLQGEESSLKMLPSFADNPTGNEEGLYLAIDLGGTNLRVLMVRLEKGFQKPQILGEPKKYKLDENNDQLKAATANEFFDTIAGYLGDFLKENSYTANYQLGYTFSFPVEQTAINSGRLKEWTKGFTVSGVVGENVVQLQEQAFQRKGITNVKISALINDTVGTQVVQAVLDHHCEVGVILGTGHNICARLPVNPVYRSKKLDNYPNPYIIVNFESGGFNKNLPRNSFDQIVDEQSERPGTQQAEKMISGKYLGEIVRVILVDLIKKGVLFNGTMPALLEKKGDFLAEHVSKIEELNLKQISDYLSNELGIGSAAVPDEEVQAVKEICEIVTYRAARLASTMIAATLRYKMLQEGEQESYTIAVDGSVYEKSPSFARRVDETFRKIFGEEKAKGIKMALTKDGSGIGAAIIAAIAEKHRLDTTG